MYDDSWYNSFVSSAQPQDEKSQLSKHQHRESLLTQPHEKPSDGSGPTGANAHIEAEAFEPQGPPTATLTRRANSYSDFYDVAIRQLRKDAAQEAEHKLSNGESIHTELDFREWFDGIEAELLETHRDTYHHYRDQLRLSQSHLDSLLGNTSATLGLLQSLSESFHTVEIQTTAFQEQCHGLISEQDRVMALADGIGRNLQYYNHLEPITRRLNAPGAGQFVRSKEFSKMLSDLDTCLEYMKAHSNHREANTYRSRYRLLLTRALTLVRVHFVTSLREIASEVSKRIIDRQLNDTTMSTLLYAKFRVGAKELKQVGQEIRRRAHPTSPENDGEIEYQSLMNEIYQSYSATRGKLVIPLLRKKIAEIAMAPSTSKDLVSFARSSIGHVRGICTDEFDLWGEWFEGEEGLYDFLESVCEPLYDHLRPRIIHETQLLKLCELCTLIQTRYMRDQDEDADAEDPSQLDFSRLIHPALEDTQTRLVFRAQAISRDEIENYRPKPEDLNYPPSSYQDGSSGLGANGPVLSGRKGSSRNQETQTQAATLIVEGETGAADKSEGKWDFAGDTISRGLYPTLRKAIWLLSRIYRLLNSAVFDDLAHQIVHQTTQSLHHAADRVNAKATATDGQLFLIKHLLALKSQIVAFDIEFVTPEVSFDFSNVTNTFWELRERGGLFNPANLMRFVGSGLMPRVVENMLDAKAELDARLRSAINDFTKTFSTRMTARLADKGVERKGGNAELAGKSTRETTEKEVHILRQKLDEYLDDARTKETLVAAVQDQVLGHYEDFYEKMMSRDRANATFTKMKGKGREDEIWDVDRFAEWAGSVFEVGRGEAALSRGDNGSRSFSQASSVS
ncbi:MAG: Golgi transport complex subunit 3 [Piccolia ochrophora]|nr:MAG: Golgi transport complex subunit 3 [Piccolia ochrophora]